MGTQLASRPANHSEGENGRHLAAVLFFAPNEIVND